MVSGNLDPEMSGDPASVEGIGTASNRSRNATRESEHLLQLRRQRWFRRPLCVPLLSVHQGEHLLLPVFIFL